MIDTRLYLVTDDPSRYVGNWLDNVLAAVESGVTCVQYRDTESDAATRLARARTLRDALRVRGVPLIVNNDAELACAVEADGVHVGQTDLPPEAVRAIVGPACEIGYSITCADDCRRFLAASPARRAAVGHLGLGPVFDATKTKRDAAPALGTEGLAELVRLTSDYRNVAIGGLTLDNAPRVLAVGARGLALVSAFSKAPDPRAVARAFRRLFA